MRFTVFLGILLVSGLFGLLFCLIESKQQYSGIFMLKIPYKQRATLDFCYLHKVVSLYTWLLGIQQLNMQSKFLAAKKTNDNFGAKEQDFVIWLWSKQDERRPRSKQEGEKAALEQARRKAALELASRKVTLEQARRRRTTSETLACSKFWFSEFYASFLSFTRNSQTSQDKRDIQKCRNPSIMTAMKKKKLAYAEYCWSHRWCETNKGNISTQRDCCILSRTTMYIRRNNSNGQQRRRRRRWQ